jgi:hypothetical protein
MFTSLSRVIVLNGAKLEHRAGLQNAAISKEGYFHWHKVCGGL